MKQRTKLRLVAVSIVFMVLVAASVLLPNYWVEPVATIVTIISAVKLVAIAGCGFYGLYILFSQQKPQLIIEVVNDPDEALKGLKDGSIHIAIHPFFGNFCAIYVSSRAIVNIIEGRTEWRANALAGSDDFFSFTVEGTAEQIVSELQNAGGDLK